MDIVSFLQPKKKKKKKKGIASACWTSQLTAEQRAPGQASVGQHLLAAGHERVPFSSFPSFSGSRLHGGLPRHLQSSSGSCSPSTVWSALVDMPFQEHMRLPLSPASLARALTLGNLRPGSTAASTWQDVQCSTCDPFTGLGQPGGHALPGGHGACPCFFFVFLVCVEESLHAHRCQSNQQFGKTDKANHRRDVGSTAHPMTREAASARHDVRCDDST